MPPSPAHHGISARAFSPGYFKTFFVEERELGRGGKGVVLLVRHILDGVNLGRFACKRVPVGDDHEWLEKVLIEVQLLQNLSHQNLVSYRHVWLEDYQITNFGPSVPCAFILQQYCNSGDLHNYILEGAKTTMTKEQLKERMRRRSKGQMEDPQDLNGPRRLLFEEIIGFFKDITSGLNFLHINGYVHRDLKPSNCLLHNTGRKMRVLVSDFGEMQAANAVRKSTGATGTISYCAPEVLRQETPGGPFGNFTTKSDIFSLGMIVYFMCFARLPYVYADGIDEEKEDLDQLRAEITTWAGFDDERRVRTDLPDKLYRSLKRLLALQPDDRPGTEEILQALKSPSLLDEFNDFASPAGLNEFVPRISRVETPSPSPGQLHRNRSSVHFGKHGRSGLSSSAVPERSPSPGAPAHQQSAVRTPSPEEASVILRSRKVELPPSRNSSASGPSPRLMLPPTSMPQYRGYDFLSDPTYIGAIKVALFAVKLFSLFRPCQPFAADPWVAYPLLGLASYDLMTVALTNHGSYIRFGGLRRSALFMILHGIVILTLMRWDRLCLKTSVPWEEPL
jgi:serine/threonine protein kinase